MGGIRRLCKLYGGIKLKGQDGKEVEYMWDYAKDEPRIKSEMTKEEIKASEKAKWEAIGEQLKNLNKE